MVISELTNKEKIKLFNELYTDLAGQGINGDTELAHVNKYEASVLKAMGGSGTLNENTGLRQYDIFSGDDSPAPAPAPSSTTVRQVSDLPDYFKPYAEKLLATAEKVYDQPYVPYEGERLAAPTQAQETALRGIESLFTGPGGEFLSPITGRTEQAYKMAEAGGQRFADIAPGEFAATYMSPYQQAVTDIQKREFAKEAAKREQQRADVASKAGAFGGSRDVLERMLGEEATQRGLSDIQATGLQAAYEQGLRQFEADRAAQRQAASQIGQIAGQEQAQILTGLGALQTAGETQRGLAQQPLDIQYEEFSRQQQAPKQALQELSGILRGVPVTPSTYQTSQQFQQPPSLGQQLLGAGTVAAGISSGLGKSFFGGAKAQGGLVGLAKGGMVEKYQEGGSAQPWFTKPVYTIISDWMAENRKERDKRIAERAIKAEKEGLIDVPDEFDISTLDFNYNPRPDLMPIEGDEDTLDPFDISTLDFNYNPLLEEKQKNLLEEKQKNQDEKIDYAGQLEDILPYFTAAAQILRPGQDTATAALAGLEKYASAKAKIRKAETEEEKLKLKRQQVAGLNKLYEGQTAATSAKAYRDAMTLSRDTLLKQSEFLKPVIESLTEQLKATQTEGPERDKIKTLLDAKIIQFEAIKNAYQKKFGTLPTIETKKKPKE